MPQQVLVVLYGPPGVGKSSAARLVARRIPGPSACVHHDDLMHRWIVTHAEHPADEWQLIYTQAKLLTSAYLKAGYSVVVEGAFAEWDGRSARSREDEIDQLLAAAGSTPVQRLVARLEAPDDVLEWRLLRADRDRDVPEAVAVAHVYRRTGDSTFIVDTNQKLVDEVAAAIMERLAR
jgi:predicted kinase